MRTIFKALSAVQRDLAARGIAKTDTNTFDKYQFRGIDAVLNTLAPILSAHEVILIPSVDESEIRTVQSGAGKPMNHCKVKMTFTFYDAEGDSVSHTFHGEAMDRGDKSLNKACTAAYKYFLFEAFTIPVEGTPDADSESHELGEALITGEDVDKLKSVLAIGDAMDYMAFRDGYSEEAFNELFNAAPHGQKTKWKNAARDLEREAFDHIDKLEHAMKEAVSQQDAIALSEVTGELTAQEKRLVWARFTDVEQEQIKALKEAA